MLSVRVTPPRNLGGDRRQYKEADMWVSRTVRRECYSRPEPRPSDRPQRDSGEHVEDDARGAPVHDAVVVAILPADVQLARA